jgi:hypothetical protein
MNSNFGFLKENRREIILKSFNHPSPILQAKWASPPNHGLEGKLLN